jgi:cell division protein FtsB
VSVDLGIWSRLTKLAVGLVVLAVLLLIGMCYLPVIKKNEQFRRQLLIDQDKIAKEEARERELKAELNDLLHNPKTFERLARERLDFARPDEIVVRFEPPATNTAGR